MRKLFLPLFTFFILTIFIDSVASAQGFHQEVEPAAELARTENKQVLLFFTGSDWCKPCIMFKREVLSAPEFQTFAAAKLELVNLDFPFKKKNLPSAEVQAYNEKMADRYNPEGKFPRILLLDADQNVLRELEYKPGMHPKEFVSNLQTSL